MEAEGDQCRDRDDEDIGKQIDGGGRDIEGPLVDAGAVGEGGVVDVRDRVALKDIDEQNSEKEEDGDARGGPDEEVD